MWGAEVELRDTGVAVGDRNATMGTEVWPWGQKWDHGDRDSTMRIGNSG